MYTLKDVALKNIEHLTESSIHTILKTVQRFQQNSWAGGIPRRMCGSLPGQGRGVKARLVFSSYTTTVPGRVDTVVRQKKEVLKSMHCHLSFRDDMIMGILIGREN
jgi:hypothetical protein